jgi:transposase
MIDLSAKRKDEFQRVEGFVGSGRRRAWTTDQKGRIVAESYVPGAVISEIARRHELRPQQVFCWRHEAKKGLLALPWRWAIAIRADRGCR